MSEQVEVPLTQYIPPNGRKKQATATIPKELEKVAAGLIFSAEVLATGLVAVYGRRKGDPEESEQCEIAENNAGKNSPDKKLIKIIKHFRDEKK